MFEIETTSKLLLKISSRINLGYLGVRASSQQLTSPPEQYAKKTTGLGKMYPPPKIHKRLYDAPGRPATLNCGTPTEKAAEPLHHHLKPVMQEGESYIKDTGDFLDKSKNINAIPQNAILASSDVVGPYPSIPN